MAVSGIMVDGMAVDSEVIGGSVVDRKKFNGDESPNATPDFLKTKYENADLVVINASSGGYDKVAKEGVDYTDDPFVNSKGEAGFWNAYFLYGNNMVKAIVYEKDVADWERKGIKYVWAHQRPYILGGDQYNKIILILLEQLPFSHRLSTK
ncbi:MAG: hypothetical protein GY861_17630 [bacterium]|nr:hypothetical protein [bacterium]